MPTPQPTPILIGFEGTRLDQTLQQHLLKINPAGIVLFKRNILSLSQTRDFIREVRDLLGPVLVAVDHEGGIVNRFPADCPSPPSPMALNRTGNPELLAEACRIQVELLAYLGINLNLAPVLDLFTEDRNPAIGTRSFSRDPAAVSSWGRVSLATHEKFQTGCTAKHFPGHGRTATDTHTSAGEVNVDLDTLRQHDLLPFRELVASGVPAVMPAHLIYPALDRDVPAMFSRRILSELLREEMGFQGLVISDCVEMAAINERFTPDRIAWDGLKAGIDLFISSFSLKRSTEFQIALKKVLDEAIEKADVQAGAILNRLELFRNRYPGKPAGKFNRDPDPVVSLHRRSIEKRKTVPDSIECKGAFLLELLPGKTAGINADASPGPVAERLVQEMNAVQRHKILDECRLDILSEVIEQADDHELAIVLLTTRGAARDGYDRFLTRLRETDRVLHISLVDERDLCGGFDHEWVTWGYNAWTASALAAELDLVLQS